MVVCALSEQARRYSLVKLCIRQAQRVKLVSKQHEHNISLLQDQQLKDKILKENSSRRKIEKKLQCVAERKWNYQMSVLSNVSVICNKNNNKGKHKQ